MVRNSTIEADMITSHARTTPMTLLAIAVLCAVVLPANRVEGGRGSSTADREEPPEPTTLRHRPDGSDPWARLKLFVNMSYLQCMYHMSRLYRVNADPPYFADAFGGPSHLPEEAEAGVSSQLPTSTASTRAPQVDAARRARDIRNPCGFQHIPEDYLYSGIDSLILAGDSTLMRSYMHIVHASDTDYVQKVAALDEDIINTTLPLSNGRRLPVYFVRMLHVSVAALSLERVFDLATRNSLILLTIGSHDTSWLVFRRPMPGFRRAFTGNWFQAKKYWRRFVPLMTNYIANRLQRFEESAPAGAVFKKPVVIVREQYLANCLHPKFSKYPLITRCRDLLMPYVIPFYRGYLSSMMATINVPTISSDALHPPCFLLDAGHTTRFCKRFELQMFAQAFRETRRLVIDQGWPKAMTLSRNTLHIIVESHVLWRDLSILITDPPYGYPGSRAEFPHRGVVSVEMAKQWLGKDEASSDMRQLLSRFDNPKMMEKEIYIPWNDGVEREGPTVGGSFRRRNYSEPVEHFPYLYSVIPRELVEGPRMAAPAAADAAGPGVPSIPQPATSSELVLKPRLQSTFYVDVDTVCLAVGVLFFAAAGYMILKP